MRRTILGVFLVMAATACGGEATLGTSPDLTSGTTKVAGAWSEVRNQIQRLKAGSYRATLISQRCSKATTADCRLTSRTIHNNGTFRTDPVQVDSTLVVDQPADESAADSGDVRMLAVGDGSLYLLDPSTSSTCWQRLDRAFASTFETTFRSGLAVLRSAEVSYDLPASGGTLELAARANALAVIRTLGLTEPLDATYGITEETRTALDARTVGITLKIAPGGSAVSFQVDGRQVASELHPGAVDAATAYVSAVQNGWSTFTLSDFGTAPKVTAPPADQVLSVTGSCVG